MARCAIGTPDERRMTAAIIDAVSSLCDQVRGAAAEHTSLRVVGAGSWLDAGRPTRSAAAISARDLSGISAYVPGDLTLTAGAGTTLGEVRAATAEHGQWLALDPFGSDGGTLGATLATASAGPLSTSFGTARDLTLGVEVVTGAGAVVRGGGRVVKNVAGFDLTRLYIGSWGTLGVITEVTLRLHARPQCDETFVISLGDSLDVGRTRTLLRHVPFTPYACEIVNAALAQQLFGTEQPAVIFRLGGNDEAVRAQRSAIAELGEVRPADSDTWRLLRQSEPEQAMVFRLSHTPSALDRTWNEANTISDSCPGTLIHATPARGVVRCVVPAGAANVAWLQRAFGAPTMTTRIGERLPAELWAVVAPRPTADPLSAGIKATFDPHSVLNPGILGEMT
jgi:glycolate oxidase FAD binding subunit